MALTSIADRLTPSVPIEITFGAQPTSVGRKITTLFGHLSTVGAVAAPYSSYNVINVGDPDAAYAEVEAVAGVGAEAARMAAAFVRANSAVLGRSNFPAFRIIFLAAADLDFGGVNGALMTAKFLRSDMFVSPYPAEDATNRSLLLDLVTLVSGVDRDLNGQFGSFASFGSLAAYTGTADALGAATNSLGAIIHYLRDQSTISFVKTANINTASDVILSIQGGTSQLKVGDLVAGAGIPVGTRIIKILNAVSVRISLNATATTVGVSLTFSRVGSQTHFELAAACAGAMMSFGVPYVPLQGVEIGGLLPPTNQADWIDIDPNGISEAALISGLSPLYIQPGNKVGFIRTRTTLVLLPDGVTARRSYFDYQDIVVIYDFRESCYLISQNPPFNNNPGGAKASRQLALQLKDVVLAKAFEFETAGMFQDVKRLSKQFVVAASTTSRGRFDFRIPVDVVPGLYVIAGNIQAVTQLGLFTV